LKLRSTGRLIALASVAAIAFAACSSSGSTAAPSAAPSTAGSAAAGALTVGYLPKDIVNQYFAAAKTGVDKAATTLGATVTQVGPNEAKANLQIHSRSGSPRSGRPPDPVHHGSDHPEGQRDHHLGRRQG